MVYLEALTISFLGLCFGSFILVVVDRLVKGETLLGRSHCDSCLTPIDWYDLIPVLSFILLKRKCRRCKTQLSFYYPVVEIITALVFILSWYFVKPQSAMGLNDVYLVFSNLTIETNQITSILFTTYSSMILTGFIIQVLIIIIFISLLVIFFTDVKYYLIPDISHVWIAVTTILILILLNVPWPVYVYKTLSSIFVMLPILLIYLATKGKGMGFGDVKFAAVMGFILGVLGGFIALYISFITGALVGIITLVLKKKGLKSKIPFGPFLVMSTIIVLLLDNYLFSMIRQWYGL